MTTLWKAVLGVILIFIFGFVSGAVCSSIYAHHEVAVFMKHPAQALMKAMEKRLTKGLKLDAGQQARIDGYFLENLRQHKQLQAQIQPQVQALNQATVKQITATLRPDQQARFNQNLDDLRKRLWKYASNPGEGSATEPAPRQDAGGANSGPASPPATK